MDNGNTIEENNDDTGFKDQPAIETPKTDDTTTAPAPDTTTTAE